MKKILVTMVVIFLLLFASQSHASNYLLWASCRTGGGACLDGINGSDIKGDGTNIALQAGDAALVVMDLGSTTPGIYFYRVYASSAAESDPDVITPDTNPGTLRWHLIKITYLGAATGTSLGLTADTNQIILNSDGTNAKITLTGTGATSDKIMTFPNVTGTAVVSGESTTSTQAMFATSTAGAPAFRAIAVGDLPGTTGTGSTVVLSANPQITTGRVITDFSAGTAGAATLGNNALPFSSVFIGAAATNNIQLTGTATSAKAATFPDVTGVVAVATASTTATQALFATTTTGAPAYRAIATADLPSALPAASTIATTLTVPDIILTSVTAGSRLTGGNGTLTIKGEGDGTDENLVFNLNVADKATISSGTGVTKVDFSALNLVTTGTIQGGIAINSDANGMSAAEMTAVGVYGTLFIASGAGTWILPTAVAGMSLCVMDSGTSHDLIVDVTTNDYIILKGTTLVQNAGITNAATATTGDFVCLVATAAGYWSTMGMSGAWVTQ